MGMPYFLENEDWYTVDDESEDGRGYHLTENAPQEAIDSYNAFYAKPEITFSKDNEGIVPGDFIVF